MTTIDRSALLALAHAYDKEDAAQRGEPDPWPADGEQPTADDVTWREERLACAEVAAQAFFSAPSAAAPDVVELVERLRAAVPAEKPTDPENTHGVYGRGYADGWNACRKAMLSAAPSPQEGR